jgi:hypothetical protein
MIMPRPSQVTWMLMTAAVCGVALGLLVVALLNSLH